MLTIKFGNIFEPDKWATHICPLSMSGQQLRYCVGPKCTKWVTLLDVLYLLPSEDKKGIMFVYDTEEDQSECGFCTL